MAMKKPAAALALLDADADGAEGSEKPEVKKSGIESLEMDAEGKPGKKGSSKVLYHLKSLAKKGDSTALDNYKSLQSDHERRAFALKLRVDPSAAFLTVSEENSASSSTIKGKVVDWFAAWEIAKTEGLKYDLECPILQSILEPLETRPYQGNDKLKSAGHLQYRYTKHDKTRHQATKTRAVTTKAQADLNESEYDGIGEMLDDEAPCEGIPGRGSKRKLSKAELASKKKADEEKKEQAKQAKFAKMSPQEAEDYEREEAKKQWLANATKVQRKLNSCYEAALKHQTNINKAKGNSLVNVNKIKQTLKQVTTNMEAKQQALTKVIASSKSLDINSIKSKKFSHPIFESQELFDSWDDMDKKIKSLL